MRCQARAIEGLILANRMKDVKPVRVSGEP